MNFIINNIVTSCLVVVVHGTLEIAKKTNFNISLLQIGAKLYHKLGKFLLQIGASVITNWGSFILLQIGTRFYCKLGQLFLLQIGTSVISNWGSLIITNLGKFYYKSGQLLQIWANVITN